MRVTISIFLNRHWSCRHSMAAIGRKSSVASGKNRPKAARDVARRIAKTPEYLVSRCERKKVEVLFAHLKRIMKLDRLRLRGLTGATDEFTLAATVQNLRRMAKLLPQGPPLTG